MSQIEFFGADNIAAHFVPLPFIIPHSDTILKAK